MRALPDDGPRTRREPSGGRPAFECAAPVATSVCAHQDHLVEGVWTQPRRPAFGERGEVEVEERLGLVDDGVLEPGATTGGATCSGGPHVARRGNDVVVGVVP